MKKLITLVVALLFTTVSYAASVNLAWDPSVTPGVNYRVFQSAGTAPFVLVLTTSSTSATLTFTGTTRFYTTAFNSDGESVASNVLTVVAPASPPAPPTNLRSTAISASRIDLQWDPYEALVFVERNNLPIATVGPGFSYYLDTGLRQGKWYSYRIRGDGTEYSNTTTAKTFRPHYAK